MIGLTTNTERSKIIGCSHGPPHRQYRLKVPSIYGQVLRFFTKPNDTIYLQNYELRSHSEEKPND